MEPQSLAIPPFRTDGYLPQGLYRASEAEVLFRFGTSNRRRRRLALGAGIGSDAPDLPS